MLWLDEKIVLEKTNLCLTCLLVAIKLTDVRFAKLRRHCFSAKNSKITSTANTETESAAYRCPSK